MIMIVILMFLSVIIMFKGMTTMIIVMILKSIDNNADSQSYNDD